MSGIAGVVRFDGRQVDPGLVETMTAAIDYRGPDGIAHWVNGPVALGQCMLRTTVESLEERQPLRNEDESLVLVIDGRVDNWEELRRELLAHGAVLRDRSDAELVLRAYEAWGRSCLSHVDGDFALVIWDSRTKTAFCARDRMGNKPFHYHWNGSTFAFASDLHALLGLPWVNRALNEGMVAEFLAMEWLSRDETLWSGILRLEPARRMSVDLDGPRQETYWEPDPHSEIECDDPEAVVALYRQTFTDAVRRQTRSSHPVACEVSGGLDSSAIFAVATELHRQGLLPAPSLDGYVLAFPGDPDADELEFARAVGRHLGRAIDEIPPSRMPLGWYRDRAKRFREFPAYPNGVMALGLREAAMGRGSRVLLAGVGGDEWLCGTRLYYAEALQARKWLDLRESFREDARSFGTRRSWWWLLRHGVAPLLPASLRRAASAAAGAIRPEVVDRMAWLTPSLQTVLKRRRQEFRPACDQKLSRAGQRRQRFLLQGAFSVWARESEERLAASVGLEIRRPFWEAKLVQFSFSTPERLRLRGGLDKSLHRRAMAGLLPDEVLARTTKADFMVTFRWHLKDLEADMKARSRRGPDRWVEAEAAERLFREFGNPRLCGWPEWMLWSWFGCDAACGELGLEAE